MKLRKIVTLAISCLVVFATNSLADITGTTGAVVDISATPPASVQLDQLQANNQIYAFKERDCFTLSSPVNVDISVPGTYTWGGRLVPPPTLTPGIIPAGTIVESHLIHYDRVATTGFTIVSGSATFDKPILGLIVVPAQLDASDGTLGRVGTAYPTGVLPARGLEFEEFVDLSTDRLTVTVQFEIEATFDNTIDQVRVITECPPPPPPPGADGCTPGFWKQCASRNNRLRTLRISQWLEAGFDPDADFDATFGVNLFNPNITLCEAVNLGGGGVNKLARHGTAALLNAAHPGVGYPLTVAEVIAAVQAGDADTLVTFNESFCPLDSGQ